MDYFELQSNEFTHLIFFVRYDSQWFAGLFVIETKEIQFYCPSIKIREKVITILNNVLIDEFKVESDK